MDACADPLFVLVGDLLMPRVLVGEVAPGPRVVGVDRLRVIGNVVGNEPVVGLALSAVGARLDFDPDLPAALDGSELLALLDNGEGERE